MPCGPAWEAWSRFPSPVQSYNVECDIAITIAAVKQALITAKMALKYDIVEIMDGDLRSRSCA